MEPSRNTRTPKCASPCGPFGLPSSRLLPQSARAVRAEVKIAKLSSMDRIRERLRRFTRGRPAPAPSEPSGPQPPPPLPVLPVTRPRPLTATPCAPGATGESRLFQYIPSEIRRSILVAAFGERTLHFDLRLEHPLRAEAPGANGRRGRRQPQHQPQPQPHANAHMFNSYHRDPQRPQEWTWWSSVCHRAVPYWNFHPPPPGSGHFADPANDTCRKASGDLRHCCDYYPGIMPNKCFIGVVPWLLTCRQAYIEGIDVLYATNRIHIAHAGILINLPRSLIPNRLLMIREVELVWSLCLSSSGADRGWTTGAGDDQFSNVNDRLVMFSHIPRILPNLQYIHLSLTDGKWAWKPMIDLCGWELYNATETILRSIDTAVFMQLAQLRGCRVSLSTSLYWTRKKMEKNEDVIWASRATDELDVLWRTIDLAAERRNTIKGYWITHGQREIEEPIITEAW